MAHEKERRLARTISLKTDADRATALRKRGVNVVLISILLAMIGSLVWLAILSFTNTNGPVGIIGSVLISLFGLSIIGSMLSFIIHIATQGKWNKLPIEYAYGKILNGIEAKQYMLRGLTDDDIAEINGKKS